MKKKKQLELTLDNSKSEDGEGDYNNKTQNLFKFFNNWNSQCISISLAWKGPVTEFNFWNIVKKGLYGVDFLSVQVIV